MSNLTVNINLPLRDKYQDKDNVSSLAHTTRDISGDTRENEVTIGHVLDDDGHYLPLADLGSPKVLTEFDPPSVFDDYGIGDELDAFFLPNQQEKRPINPKKFNTSAPCLPSSLAPPDARANVLSVQEHNFQENETTAPPLAKDVKEELEKAVINYNLPIGCRL